MTSTSPAAGSTAAEPAASRPSIWFRNAWFDTLLIVGTPFLVWPLIKLAEGAWSAELLGQLILLTATGHYFATFVRAYGDRELRARFKTRFTVVPIVLLCTCVWAFTSGTAGPLLLVTGAWAWWHWLAQAFGFARIYDAKIGSFRPTTAMLDKALVVSWFFGAIVLNERATANFAALFHGSGIATPGPDFFAGLRSGVFVLVAVVTLAYVANLILTIVRGERVSWVKQCCHFTTIGFYWFAFGYMPNFFIGYVLYELFHDIQYFAIVWLSGRSRIQRDGVTPWMRGLFRPGAAHAVMFVAAMLAFGVVDFGTRERFDGQGLGEVLKGVFLTVALLHYYYDGFIWRIRESDTRGDLGISGGASHRVRSGMVHTLRWGAFFVPIILLTMTHKSATAFTEMEKAKMSVDAAPGSFEAQANYAYGLVTSGDFERGLAHYEKSVAIYGGSAKTQFNYAAALEFSGRVTDAIHHYREGLACPDQENIHAKSHVHIGICLQLTGDADGAQAHFQAAAELGGQSPFARISALVSALTAGGQIDRAIQYLEVARKLSPDDDGVRLHLADLLVQTANLSAAEAHYRAVLTRDPNQVDGLVGLATIRMRQGRRADAKLLVDQALRINPQMPAARALEAQLSGRR